MTHPIGYIINHELFVEYNPDTADRASRRPSYVPVNSVNDPILEQYKVIRRREHAGGYELERINFRAQCSIDTCQNCGSSRNHRSMRKYETQGDVEVLIKCSDCVVQGFHITFNKGGWGFLPVADGVELCESFLSKDNARKWLNENNVKNEREFAIAQYQWDNMLPEDYEDYHDDFDYE